MELVNIQVVTGNLSVLGVPRRVGMHALLSDSIAKAGVDDVDSYEELCRFVRTVAERGGVGHFLVHARKCMLAGLTPAQNRSVPPLRWGLLGGMSGRTSPVIEYSCSAIEAAMDGWVEARLSGMQSLSCWCIVMTQRSSLHRQTGGSGCGA
jgi:hypothetical protein